MNQTQPQQTHFCWCFLEIFSCEGGIQSYVKNIFDAYTQIAPPNLRSDVFLLRDSPQSVNPYPESDTLKFHYFKSKHPALGRLKLAASLLTYLIQYRPQRVFCGHVNLAHLVQTLCQPLGIPYTVMTHGKEVWDPLPMKYRRALQQADQIWTVSRYSYQQASQSNQLDPNRFQIVPCMVDGNRFTPGAKSQALIEHYGLADAKVLMTVARLWSGDIYKGVDVTLRALPKITQAFPDVKYLVVGRGDDQPRLAQLAQDLGVADQVVFAGFVGNEALIDHYRVADAYIMPSQEGFGIVYLEAMACGIPVLSGDADGSADPLQEGKLGWQVPYRDPEAVAHACIEILQAQDQRCQGSWLRAKTLAKFGQEAFRERLQDLLKI